MPFCCLSSSQSLTNGNNDYIIRSVCEGTWYGSRRLLQARSCRRHISRLLNNHGWPSHVSRTPRACPDCMSFLTASPACHVKCHSRLNELTLKMPDVPAWQRWQWARCACVAEMAVSSCVAFLPASCHREERDTCSDAQRTSADCACRFWRRWPAHMQWNVGHMPWSGQCDAISSSWGLWRVVSDRQDLLRAVVV